MNRRQFIGLAGASVLGAGAGRASPVTTDAFTGYETNKIDRKKEVEDGGWVVAWADDVSEADAANGLVATGIVVGASGSGAVRAWAKELVRCAVIPFVQRTREEIPDGVRGRVEATLVDVVRRAVKGESEVRGGTDPANVEFKVGAMKYVRGNYARGKLVAPSWGLKPFVGFRLRGIDRKANFRGLIHECEVAFRAPRDAFLNCFAGDGEVQARSDEYKDKADRGGIWTLHRESGPGQVKSGDAVAFRTYRGVYLSCVGSRGEVRGRSDGDKHSAGRDEYWRIWKAFDPVKQNNVAAYQRIEGDVIVSGDRVFFETGSGVIINCAGGQGKLAARIDRNRKLAQHDEVLTVFLASQLPEEAQLKLVK